MTQHEVLPQGERYGYPDERSGNMTQDTLHYTTQAYTALHYTALTYTALTL